ncbi:MAG: 30S ribosomal protein S3 [Candidatus Amesbacteria bacterium]|nr:30S ribosomal protein S3 [Candidatus Amesbacteria bacterium]
MGQKVNPIGFRIPLSPSTSWISRWFSTSKVRYSQYLAEDLKLRKALMTKLRIAGVTKVEIERSLKSLKIIIHVSRPGVVIGRGGAGIEDLKKYITTLIKATKVDLQIEEVKNPEINAYLVAIRIAEQLEKRLPARRVATKTIEKVMASGAKGVKILLSGRVNGAEISRRESYKSPSGSVPLQTLRANVDYASLPALTRSGYVGVKVWIYLGGK